MNGRCYRYNKQKYPAQLVEVILTGGFRLVLCRYGWQAAQGSQVWRLKASDQTVPPPVAAGEWILEFPQIKLKVVERREKCQRDDDQASADELRRAG